MGDVNFEVAKTYMYKQGKKNQHIKNNAKILPKFLKVF